MADYQNTSPYFNTPAGQETLGLLNKRMFEFEDDDVLYEILLKYGVFNQKVKTISIEGRDIYDVSNGYMIVDLNDNITEDDIKKIIEHKPQVVVFMESSFSNDNDKLNAEYTLKRNGVKDIKCI